MFIEFSMSSVIMAILTTNIFIVVCGLILKNKKLLVSIGYKVLIVTIVFSVIRLVLPVGIRNVTRNIYYSDFINDIISLLRQDLYKSSSLYLSITLFLFITWMTVTCYKGYQYIREYRLAHSFLISHCQEVTGESKYQDILSSICQKHGKRNVFRIYLVPSINAPYIMGMIKPYILIPESIDYTESELKFCIYHEANHHFHHDLCIKHFINLLAILYWWNPVCKCLMEETDILLEMHNDNEFAKDGLLQEYLSCLIEIAKKGCPNSATLPFALAISTNPSLLEKRFEIMVSCPKSRNRIKQNFVITILTLILLLSYVFAFENCFSTTFISDKLISSDNDTYIIDNLDGSYDVYYDSIYLETVLSLEYYNKSIPIYTNEGETK